MCVINFVNPAILMSYAHSQYGIGNTQILIDLAWVFSEHLLKGELYILKYNKEVVEFLS